MKKFVALFLCAVLMGTMCILPAFAEAKTTPSIAIVVAGSLGDRSFYDSANEGIEMLKKDFGTKTVVLECKEDGSLYETNLYEAAENADIVAAVGWQFYDVLPKAAEAYPDTKFLFIDNALETIPENVMCVVYKQNEGSFLAGYVAGKLSKTGKVGAVGGQDSDTINDFLFGYKAGAEYANADIKVDVQYSNHFEDPAKGKECALALYSAGCDVVFQVAGKTGEGVFEAAQETGNYAIGVDGDQKYINPDRILCSMIKRVGQSIYDVVADAENKFQPGKIWLADMATGYIDLAYGTEDMTQQVTADIMTEINAIKEKIISGEIVVPTALK